MEQKSDKLFKAMIPGSSQTGACAAVEKIYLDGAHFPPGHFGEGV
jgi:hypothetical protein